MIKLEFTEAEQQSLHYERYHHPHPRVQRQMEALWLRSQGVAHGEVSRLTGISSTTLTSYLRAYQEGGIEALKTVRFYRPQSELSVHQGTLEAYFRKHPPASAKQAMATIETLTGVRRSPDRVRLFLKHLGLKCRKVGMIPAKADVDGSCQGSCHLNYRVGEPYVRLSIIRIPGCTSRSACPAECRLRRITTTGSTS